ncbi:MAG: hypothetical protein L3J31_05970 [Bacteroidales bacterium]|nr:hypothetical protein [Bacteroidales bacterium]MCF6342335.1 hypothetical protein [Bacteroidales bacterium]
MKLKNSVLPFVFLVVIVILSSLNACKKKEIVSNDPALKLSFSNDSIIFDTVFTSLGSATHRLMVYNTSNSRINISNITLGKGANSAYRINVDGEAGAQFKDVEINGGDSLYIFLRVTIDPNNLNNPLIVEDEIYFLTNGNEQSVSLVAWGQDAHYILADTHTPGFPPYKIVADSMQTTVWTSDKPYVIYGYAVINSYGKLIIEEGTRVFFHKGSGLWAYADGVLKAGGDNPDNPVIFQGDRLEDFYEDVPGQWDRIWLMEGRPGEDHIIKNTLIKNGFIGIQAESFLRATENKVVLENVIIENMTGIGLFTRTFNVEGKNTVLANCGGYCMAVTGGGKFDFKHTTIANFWSGTVRNTPALFLNNYFLDTLEQPVPIPLNFSMGNSIIYGYNKDEFDTDMDGGADSLYFFDFGMMKTSRNLSDETLFQNILKNQDPEFLDYNINDYRLDSLSPAVGYGSQAIAGQVPFDILGNPRTESPDLGAYEFVPGQGGGDER